MEKLGRLETGEERRTQLRQVEDYEYVEEAGGDLRTTAKGKRERRGEMMLNKKLEAIRSQLLTQEIPGSDEA